MVALSCYGLALMELLLLGAGHLELDEAKLAALDAVDG